MSNFSTRTSRGMSRTAKSKNVLAFAHTHQQVTSLHRWISILRLIIRDPTKFLPLFFFKSCITIFLTSGDLLSLRQTVFCHPQKQSALCWPTVLCQAFFTVSDQSFSGTVSSSYSHNLHSWHLSVFGNVFLSAEYCSLTHCWTESNKCSNICSHMHPCTHTQTLVTC